MGANSRITKHCLIHSTSTTEITFGEMPYADGARFDLEKQCLPGTCIEILEEISHWVNSGSSDVSRIFFLSGVAGSGKSAIAHTIAKQFDDIGHLGSSFCFDRSHLADRNPSNLFSTVTQDLADLDAAWKLSLWNVIKGKKALCKTCSPKEQFEKFVVEPCGTLKSVGPIVIVIDALDECGGPASRKGLLSILAKRVVELPSNFRILVTARPEKDIQDALGENKYVTCKYMHSIDPGSANADISIFLHKQLASVVGAGKFIEPLVQKSEGLFQWAFTACQFITGHGTIGLEPAEKFQMLMSSESQNETLGPLDSLYSTVLEQIVGQDPKSMDRWRAVMGRVLTVKQPLPVSALRALGDNNDSIDITGSILQGLGSLLSGISEEHVPIQPLHTSLRDFLTDVNRSGRLYVDITAQHSKLALACLKCMNAPTGLQFNICRLKTSHVRNDEVLDLSVRLKENVPFHLAYSCQFWIVHVQETQFDVQIENCIREFLFENLLYWFEVLSLNKAVTVAITGLPMVEQWCKVSLGPQLL